MNVSKTELFCHGIRSGTEDRITQRKLGKAVQRKLRVEIDVEVDMAVKDGKDPIISLPTNEYGEVMAYSTQWQALARQEERI
jgi:hypothetical protein